MNRFSSTAATIKPSSLVLEMIIELPSQSSPWILCLPNQNTCKLCPHEGSPSFQKCSVLNIVDQLCLFTEIVKVFWVSV
uniref:Uncharacterized protein n=1 Tax=Arundo donax TaxID=35708 RepID=A0A0A9EU23_ARUDO